MNDCNQYIIAQIGTMQFSIDPLLTFPITFEILKERVSKYMYEDFGSPLSVGTFMGTPTEAGSCPSYCLHESVCEPVSNSNPKCTCTDAFRGWRCQNST